MSNRDALQLAGQELLDRIRETMGKVDWQSFLELADLLPRVRRTFVTGAGRSGLVARIFGMRLMHAGLPAFVPGETVTPAAGRDDLLVGADAVTPGWILNKTGTSMLAAVAAERGVPVYVAATRDKFMDSRAARLLRIGEHEPSVVWDTAPPGVAVRNVWFERVPGDRPTGVITEVGTLSPDMLEEACRAASADASDEDIASLLS